MRDPARGIPLHAVRALALGTVPGSRRTGHADASRRQYDLAHRKLPALYNLHLDGVLPPRTAIVGVGRPAKSDDDYRAFAKDGITHFSRRPIDAGAWQTFGESLFAVPGSFEDSAVFASLGSRLDIIEHERGLPGNRIYYLAVPPMFGPITEQLARALFTRAAPRIRS
jgi:glucose-6-phosphate 1-dehydrogenase